MIVKEWKVGIRGISWVIRRVEEKMGDKEENEWSERMRDCRSLGKPSIWPF